MKMVESTKIIFETREFLKFILLENVKVKKNMFG